MPTREEKITAYLTRINNNIRNRNQPLGIKKEKVADGFKELAELLLEFAGESQTIDGLVTPVTITGPDINGVFTITAVEGDLIKWNINELPYQIASPQYKEIEPAAADMFRQDRLLLGPNTITVLKGEESDDATVPLSVPSGFYSLTIIGVYGDIISTPPIPDPVSEAAPAWTVYGTNFGKYTHLMTVPAADSLFLQVKEAHTNISHPSYLAPLADTASSQTTAGIENGQKLNITIDSTFIQRHGGASTGLSILKDGVPISTTEPYTDEDVIITTTPKIYNVIYSYGQGPVLNNILGEPDPYGRISAGSVSDGSPLIYAGTQPYFWWKSADPITAALMKDAIEAGNATKVIASSAGTITIDFDADGEYIAFAIPATSPSKTRWYVTDIDQGPIPGGVFGAASILAVTSPDLRKAGDPEKRWTNVNYKINVATGLISQLSPFQLRNS